MKKDLCRNKTGRVMSKKQHAVLPKNAASWFSACTQARKELGIKGFVTLNRGETGVKYYKKAKEIYAKMKEEKARKEKLAKEQEKCSAEKRETEAGMEKQERPKKRVKLESLSPPTTPSMSPPLPGLDDIRVIPGYGYSAKEIAMKPLVPECSVTLPATVELKVPNFSAFPASEGDFNQIGDLPPPLACGSDFWTDSLDA